jgi:uncharacterized protein YjbJ (UPF0337 family)
MKSLPWILTGLGIGFAVAYIVLTDGAAPAPRYAGGYDSVDDAAGKAGRWGVQQRASGAGSKLAGKVKEGFGRATGDVDLADEGVLDQAAGAIKEGAGHLAQAAGQTARDLNF